MAELESLRAKISRLQRELDDAKKSLRDLEAHISDPSQEPSEKLELDEYRRYGRQMILDGFGLPSQLRLKSSRVLVIGAGGLGCPALQYLAAAGVGTLGVVDNDVVELSNLQRQILHTDERIGTPKALSAREAIAKINPNVRVNAIVDSFNSNNALELMSAYELVLDCTDNPSTRYLISDASRALGIPLISGAAMRYDGQLCTYNLGAEGPCYRCVFPMPPKPETVGTCEDVGVLGVVTGIIGTLQALEAIKLLVTPEPEGGNNAKPTLLLFSGRSATPFRTVKLRSRRSNCLACGIEREALKDQIKGTDYVAFCGGAGENARLAGLRLGPNRISVADVQRILDAPLLGGPTSILDVRPKVEFGICHLPGSKNIPLSSILANPNAILKGLSPSSSSLDRAKDILVICRQGNDSQVAAAALRSALTDQLTSGASPSTEEVGLPGGEKTHDPMKRTLEMNAKAGRDAGSIRIRDIRGGLFAWHRDVDPSFPVY